MKKVLGCIYGHYDSRGGTVFVEISDRTPESITRAHDWYNVEFFGWDPETNRAENAGVGRQCDILVDMMMRDDQSPAECDMIGMAELHLPDDFEFDPDKGNDLENYGVVFGDDIIRNNPEPDPQRVDLVELVVVKRMHEPNGDENYDWDGNTQRILEEAKAKATLDWSYVNTMPRWDDDAYGFLAFFKEEK